MDDNILPFVSNSVPISEQFLWLAKDAKENPEKYGHVVMLAVDEGVQKIFLGAAKGKTIVLLGALEVIKEELTYFDTF